MIKKIASKINDIIHPPLIQFGPIRSGSTLVYNILRDSLPEKNIRKRHNISKGAAKRNKVIVTYRNPLDCLTSTIKSFNLVPNDVNIRDQINALKKNGLNDLLIIFDNQNILKLKYEDFYYNYNLIFDSAESFLNTKINPDVREKVSKKYNLQAAIKITEKYEDFSQYDSVNHLHGRHISNTKGSPNSYIEFFTEEQLKYIKDELHDYILKFGYEETIYSNA